MQEPGKFAEEAARELDALLKERGPGNRAYASEFEYEGVKACGISVRLSDGTQFEVDPARAIEAGDTPHAAAETIGKTAFLLSEAVRKRDAQIEGMDGQRGGKEGFRDYILSHACIRLAGQGEAGDLPHVRYLDLDAIFVAAGLTGGFSFQTEVTRELMEACGITTNDLFAAALENMSPLVCPQRIRLPGRGIFHRSLQVLLVASETGMFGASVLLNREALLKMAQVLGGDILFLPLGVHAAVVLPCDGVSDFTAQDIRKIAEEMYLTAPEEERVTASAYRFHEQTGKIDIIK